MPRNQTKLYAVILIVLTLVGTTMIWTSAFMATKNEIAIYGHRGCRGLMPENSIVGFVEAMRLGVDYLEMDVVINGEDQILVSHEPWMSAAICRNAETAADIEDRDHSLYKMTQSEIRTYDCGGIHNPDFPDQLKMRVAKPLLAEVVEAVNAFEAGIEHKFGYAIEVKYEDDWNDRFVPGRERMMHLLLAEIDLLGIGDRVILMSSDSQMLKLANHYKPVLQLGIIVENAIGIYRHVENLGFTPGYYMPYYRVVDQATMEFAKENDIKVVPWTVNDTSEMKKLIDLGVGGIITDYPNQLNELISNL